MKAFSAWRNGDGGKGASDAVTELQQVILKKDLMILTLQTQLDAYNERFGALPAEVLDKLQLPDGIGSEEATARRSSELPRSIKTLSDRNLNSGALDDAAATPNAPRPSSPTRTATARFKEASETEEALKSAAVQCCSSKNVVLDFVEDSPMFRRQLEGFEESLTGLRALLKELVNHSKEYAAAGKNFGKEETALADELVQRKYARAIFSTSCPELGSLSDLFGDMHDTLEQVQSSRVSMLLGVESLLSRSIQQFSEKELLKEAGEMRKEVSRLGDEYETLLAQHYHQGLQLEEVDMEVVNLRLQGRRQLQMAREAATI
ncbi:ADP-ribosylation factor GTPase-activating protein agd4 [Phytophthora boehmeriae]|uniref:ADP-ribosylation factor GTPase-activating protein agd4 n=1 Tax=Phytophthora boehmeriae TaxID=109152 RepID=A0A8T1WSX9_9STRA|nr:ADP-ribosylation factor GTPase-activating protein agd4 [Phytophthora boehmeriae]